MMKVLIIGAGIGGLSLALHLEKIGIQPTIIDKTSEWEQEGYAIGIWDLGLRTLAPFDIYNRIKKFANYPKNIVIRNRHGDVVKFIDCQKIFTECGAPILIYDLIFIKYFWILIKIPRSKCKQQSLLLSKSTIKFL